MLVILPAQVKKRGGGEGASGLWNQTKKLFDSGHISEGAKQYKTPLGERGYETKKSESLFKN